MVCVLGRCRGNTALFLLISRLGRDQNFKRDGDVKKRKDQISRGSLFFQSKRVSHFVPVCQDTTLKERSLG